MFRKTLTVAALAFAFVAPVHAAPSFAKVGRDASRINLLPAAGQFKFAQGGGLGFASNSQSLPGLSSLSFAKSGGGAGIAQIKTAAAKLAALAPLTKNAEVLPTSALGINTTTVSIKNIATAVPVKLSGRGHSLPGNSGIVSALAASGLSLPKTGAVLLASSAGSVVQLPRVGIAELRSTLP